MAFKKNDIKYQRNLTFTVVDLSKKVDLSKTSFFVFGQRYIDF